MSKFNWDCFYTDFGTTVVFNKEKYSKEEAIEKAKFELEAKEGYRIYLEEAYVRYRYGRDEDGECRSCWWLEYEKYNRSCPVWAFYGTNEIKNYGNIVEEIQV